LEFTDCSKCSEPKTRTSSQIFASDAKFLIQSHRLNCLTTSRSFENIDAAIDILLHMLNSNSASLNFSVLLCFWQHMVIIRVLWARYVRGYQIWTTTIHILWSKYTCRKKQIRTSIVFECVALACTYNFLGLRMCCKLMTAKYVSLLPVIRPPFWSYEQESE